MPENSSVLPDLVMKNDKQAPSIDCTSISAQEDLSAEEAFILFLSLQEIAHELRRIKHAKKYPTARRSSKADL